ncbi:uncharacterized protein LOC102699687 [Oryza brachyantha]|uniref:uncharacterized protein LOC102699687 n=1 Tax=Oryza brachyantha TaxID=4533 RepID=UPI0003EAC0BB|nr:uncharacterized protein LOC102699687 [Oryza brachyantha]
MDLAGSGRSGGGSMNQSCDPILPENNVTDLLRNLNLTTDEGEVAAFSDEDEDEVRGQTKLALIGKVLSPATLHVTTIQQAMKPAWGNPVGLKIRAIGEKGNNLFIASLGCENDLKRVLGGSPWIVGRHGVILQEYDESLKPSEIAFDKMEIWVRILNLPVGWMNRQRGVHALGLIGSVIGIDVDKDGEASCPFLRGRVAIEVAKPIRRGVLLKTKKDGVPEWFEIQFEKLPFFCKSCGVMGHSKLECASPAARND